MQTDQTPWPTFTVAKNCGKGASESALRRRLLRAGQDARTFWLTDGAVGAPVEDSRYRRYTKAADGSLWRVENVRERAA